MRTRSESGCAALGAFRRSAASPPGPQVRVWIPGSMAPHERRLSAAARSMRFSAIRRLSALIERPGIISFAPGQPSPETFPVAELRAMADAIIAGESASAFQYILTRGLGPLLEEVGRYAEAKGMCAPLSQRMMTEGSQQGLDLLSRVLLDPGDVVLVELPSYIGATSAFRASRARLEGVRLTEDGPDLDHLRWRHQIGRASCREGVEMSADARSAQ